MVINIVPNNIMKGMIHTTIHNVMNSIEFPMIFDIGNCNIKSCHQGNTNKWKYLRVIPFMLKNET